MIVMYFIVYIDRYAILMIPSSIAAFQALTMIVACMCIVTCVLTAYLLGFHIYLCK